MDRVSLSCDLSQHFSDVVGRLVRLNHHSKTVSNIIGIVLAISRFPNPRVRIEDGEACNQPGCTCNRIEGDWITIFYSNRVVRTHLIDNTSEYMYLELI